MNILFFLLSIAQLFKNKAYLCIEVQCNYNFFYKYGRQFFKQC